MEQTLTVLHKISYSVIQINGTIYIPLQALQKINKLILFISWGFRRDCFAVYGSPLSAVSCGSITCDASKENTASIFRVNKLVRVGGELMVARKCVCYVGMFVEIWPITAMEGQREGSVWPRQCQFRNFKSNNFRTLNSVICENIVIVGKGVVDSGMIYLCGRRCW